MLTEIFSFESETVFNIPNPFLDKLTHFSLNLLNLSTSIAIFIKDECLNLKYF